MIFNIFYPDRNDDTITEEIEPQSLEALVKAIHNYPDARWLLFKYNAQSRTIDPTKIKMPLFTLLTVGILKINYHRGFKV